MAKAILVMEKDKVTKGAVRFSDKKQPYSHTLYLRKEEVAELGDPDKISVEIKAAK